MFFLTNQNSELHFLKQRKMKHVLSYNIQEMQRKRKSKQQQGQLIRDNTRYLEEQALNSLLNENRKRQHKRIQQRNMLKETYQRQMKEKEDKKKMEKIIDRQYFQREQQYMDYEESRRMIELGKIYNRPTYEATPQQYDRRKRIQTQPDGKAAKAFHSSLAKSPQDKYRAAHSVDVKANSSLAEQYPSWKPEPQGIKDSLDNLKTEDVRYPRKQSRQEGGQ